MSAAPQHDVQTPSAAVTAMGVSDCSDARPMARRREPIVNRRADPSALNGRIPATMMPGYQQDDAVPGRNCLFERTVDRSPGGVEVHAMKVESTVGHDRTGAQLLVPTAIESRSGSAGL